MGSNPGYLLKSFLLYLLAGGFFQLRQYKNGLPHLFFATIAQLNRSHSRLRCKYYNIHCTVRKFLDFIRAAQSPCWSTLDFWKMDFEKWISWNSMNSIFGLFQTWILQATKHNQSILSANLRFYISKIPHCPTCNLPFSCEKSFELSSGTYSVIPVIRCVCVRNLYRALGIYFIQWILICEDSLNQGHLNSI